MLGAGELTLEALQLAEGGSRSPECERQPALDFLQQGQAPAALQLGPAAWDRGGGRGEGSWK